MLETIKTLLDSGCYVEVEYQMFCKKDTSFILIYGDDGEDYIGYFQSLYRDVSGKIFIEDDKNYNEIKITSIKPIARPLYQYKVGDKVVVLDNYPAEEFIGEIGTIDTVGTGIVSVYRENGNGILSMIDIRCIAPVLD